MENILKVKLDELGFKKLEAIDNQTVLEFISKYVALCNPKNVFVSDGSPEDIDFIRKKALEDGEEMPLKIKGQTVHFDSYYDQGRDKKNTKILLDEGEYLDPVIETGLRDSLTQEVHEILKDIMNGRTMYVLFYVLGPENSPFTIPAVQITDSPYVAHSENILYRQGYSEFVRQGRSLTRFFKFVHSEGELDERKTSKNLDKRRVYIDLKDEIVYSCNTQYGGNTIGLKKLAMRLAIKRASVEGWLTEHMLLMGVNGPNGRVSYFTGAFPSMCGKTSTAMLESERIVGDDISYIKEIEGVAKAVNVEKGIFGIIQGINSKDDPIQWKALHSPNEIIFSNVLVYDDGSVYWVGHDGPIPERGINHSGEWFKGKKDEKGNEIPPSHPNARFTLHLEILENVDENLHNPNGVEVSGIIYGGRDSDTWNPVCEAFNWEHGIVLKGASIESETTAATLGKVGVREFNPMSNLDFLSIPIGKYIEINLEFGKKLKKVPKIFGVNYFLKDENGRFLNDKNDKKVWLKWMEKRVHNEVHALKTPVGFMPLYDDLKVLFKQYLGKDYKEEEYIKQFTLRVNENLSKIERLRKIYSGLKFVPKRLFELYDEEEKRLKEAQSKFGDYIQPYKFEIV
ncbi:phosphoenolpyruvate carboxykinase (GTP) [Caldisericum sp. AR60]|uniref:phosphoenolpyruvate carboxykinase (GTP) n=1 Tax=Caldisericum sp. AR60 TaxID=3397852 RepID=UPI0039FBA6DD